MVGTTVSFKINKAVLRDIMYEPRNFIGMRFNHYFVGFPGVNHRSHRTVIIRDELIRIRTHIIHPQLLSGRFKPGRTGIVKVMF